MAQQSPRSCPKCGSSVAAGQRFCSNCGTVVEEASNQPTERTPDHGMSSPVSDMETRLSTPPPPPGAQPYQPSPQSYEPPPVGNYQPQSGSYQPQPPPVYATPQKDSSGRVLGQIGCGMGLVILLVLALCAGASFFVYNSFIRPAFNNAPKSIQNSTTGQSNTTGQGNTGGSDNATPTQAPPKTTAINATVTYASVKFTIVDVQQASSFADDTSTSADKPGVVRIDLKEEDTSKRGSSYYLGDAMRLILPDNTSVAPLNAKSASPPDALVARTNWVDFAVPSTVDVTHLTLHFGTTTEAPIDVALTANSDVSKYQAKTVTPNKQVQYTDGNWTTNWTITSASSQLSYNGKQAGKGMVYVIVSAKIDNPSARDFGGYPGDYMRLKAGDATSSPSDFTIPTSVAASSSNATGEVAFLVPQNNTNFTLTLLAGPTRATQDVPVSFQIS